MAKNKKTSPEMEAEYAEAQLASYWNFRFKDAMVQKAPYTKKWNEYWDAYSGDYFKNENLPDYKSDFVANYIFSIIETIRPIMLDNDPKFQALPRHPDAMNFSQDLQEAFSYEWDRESMNPKLFRELITTLVTGSTIMFMPWDAKKKEIKAVPVNPFNLFPDPLATSIEDAEFLIYATYRNSEVLKRSFPSKASRLHGGNINYGELVHDNNKDANVDNQILVLEVWTRDYQTFEAEDKSTHQKYPNGRVITLCPDHGLVLSDKPNPYKDGHFPFLILKDYDVPGKFWGEGEVAQLLSPQKHMNELNNAILDNAKATANMPWVIDKNAGIGFGKITNRPGLVLRKNPGSEVKRQEAPNMPAYVGNAVEGYKHDMEQISGIFDSLKGNSETGVYTAQGILALQEAGQARIRLKVKLMEDFLGKLATMWFYRMKQFWQEDRFVRIVKPDGTYDFSTFTREVFEHDYDVRILAGSTMPVNRGAMLDLMIRLAQTAMPDGQTIVDREAVVEYLPTEIKSAVLGRMQTKATAMEEQLQQLGQMGEELKAQLEQVSAESTENDTTTFDVIEDLTGTLESVNKKILQLQKDYDKMKEEQSKAEETDKLRKQFYNEGYSDAEKLSQEGMPTGMEPADSMLMGEQDPSMMSGDPMELGEFSENANPMGEGLGEAPTENLGEELPEMPEDILEGIEDLSDDELELLLQQRPELAELLR